MTEWEFAKDFLKCSVTYVFVVIPALTAMLAVLGGTIYLLVKGISSFM